jgi:LTXXQ motif family protein
MLKKSITLLAAAATLVVGTAASLGQSLPPGLPPGAPPPPFMMPTPFLAGSAVPSPQEMCVEMSALRAGYFAYLRQRLDLTPAQAPLWREVESAVGEMNTAARTDCAALPTAPEKPALSQALAFAERHLAARRQGLQHISAPLLKLYEGLSPEQREIMDRAVPPPMIL